MQDAAAGTDRLLSMAASAARSGISCSTSGPDFPFLFQPYPFLPEAFPHSSAVMKKELRISLFFQQ